MLFLPLNNLCYNNNSLHLLHLFPIIPLFSPLLHSSFNSLHNKLFWTHTHKKKNQTPKSLTRSGLIFYTCCFFNPKASQIVSLLFHHSLTCFLLFFPLLNCLLRWTSFVKKLYHSKINYCFFMCRETCIEVKFGLYQILVVESYIYVLPIFEKGKEKREDPVSVFTHWVNFMFCYYSKIFSLHF